MKGPIPAQFEVVKVKDDQYDVLIFSSLPVIKAFNITYPETIYIEKSNFNNLPMIVVPDFDSNFKARAWIGYWKEALSYPEKACKSCEIVQYFFKTIEDFSAGAENQNNESEPRQTPNDPRSQKKED